jgi:hypothetical protein
LRRYFIFSCLRRNTSVGGASGFLTAIFAWTALSAQFFLVRLDKTTVSQTQQDHFSGTTFSEGYLIQQCDNCGEPPKKQILVLLFCGERFTSLRLRIANNKLKTKPMKTIPRRDAIKGLTATLATFAFLPSSAVTRIDAETYAAQGLEDPREKYPKPPFKKQSQPWPGLAGKMDPQPDHGEKSYKGSGRLTGRKALITGGDSGMGRAAAIAFAREGADVAINYLPDEESDAKEVVELIKAAGKKAVPIPGDLRDENFCKQLVEQAAKELGGLDILVNNAARQQTRKSIADVSSEDFDNTMKTNIYAPFWLTKAALPHLKPGSVIIFHRFGTSL